MTQTQSDAVKKFEDTIGISFQLYNSLFLSLPFFDIEKTGTLLTLFNQTCETGFENQKSPADIIEDFFSTATSLKSEKEKIDLLFRFVQYAERQVVLFDALEDAAFDKLHNLEGSGSITQLQSVVRQDDRRESYSKRLEEFSVRLVLTAHPTQFYPGWVLGIINDLSKAIDKHDAAQIKLLLQQLGRTPFFKKKKPTPTDEASSLIWYLQNVFYHSIGHIISEIKSSFPDEEIDISNLIKMGFWSGGDRDGNPFVTVETTRNIAKELRRSILRCYYEDVKLLQRRLTFSGVEKPLAELERQLYENAFQDSKQPLSKAGLLNSLKSIRETLLDKHRGLFKHLLQGLIDKVELFGLHFASLDIRQDSSIHKVVYEQIVENTKVLPNGFLDFSEDDKIEAILNVNQRVELDSFEDLLTKDTFETTDTVREIQHSSGEQGCNRYIISNSQGALDVIEVFGFFLMRGWKKENLTVDIVPLFETVEDLQNAGESMRKLYENETYRDHLGRRGDTQTIMLGFSDGTKDGGYLMANYSIYRAKDELTKVSRKYGIEVIFFDGRGGPPARGGGKTHKFYSSMGKNISDKAIELTVQGQTVSSNFGTIDAARYNIEQMLSAGIYSAIFDQKESTFSDVEEALLQDLAADAFDAYSELKGDPAFLSYLENVSPLKYFAKANIGSRPAKRGGASAKLTLKSLRAIPFVGAWSQMKQNVPGFYGVGKAIEKADAAGNLEAVTSLYKNNAFFKALVDNCEMAMQKTSFQLTRHLENDAAYGEFWKKIRDEYNRTKKYLDLVTGKDSFMTDFPVARESVKMREKIVLPLTTIQQYALTKIREKDNDHSENYEKLVVRCSFGIINAGRNSA